MGIVFGCSVDYFGMGDDWFWSWVFFFLDFESVEIIYFGGFVG